MKRAARRAKQKRQRENVKVFSANSYLLATLRIVLLGYSQSGKTSVGNTMLGPEVFDQKPTAFCEWHHRSIAGQRLSVVDTPGWQKCTPAAGNPSRTMEEMSLSVPLCHPGPHAVLLVIRADASFGANEGRAACQHLELVLGKQVWRHTLVLFTCGDGLGGVGAGDAVTVEQYMESEGDALKQIVEKCGNRYHVLDNKANKTSGANTQVLQLLEKLKGMVALNGGGHLETGGLRTDGARDGRGVKDNTSRERRKTTRRLWMVGREDGRGETRVLWKDGARDGRGVNERMMRSGEVRYGRGLEHNTGRDGRRKEMLDGNWMRLDVSEESSRSRCLAEGRLHRFSKSPRCRYSPVHTEDTIWPDGFRRVSEEDQLDNVFLEGSPQRRDAPLFSLHVHGPLTPIPSAEQSLASSSTSISKLV
ncbi:GTPase IMAP family member 8-like [Engraulis encrasicolus]|uniref:GTPase IMAP family member 8-like n=1 Tax=Engraulis encrasicolus TaxID=184585 RepID=UPI002FCFD876